MGAIYIIEGIMIYIYGPCRNQILIDIWIAHVIVLWFRLQLIFCCQGTIYRRYPPIEIVFFI